MVSRDDYTHIEEVLFYRDKYKQISDELEVAADGRIDPETTRERISAILVESPPYTRGEVMGDISPVMIKK